MSKLGEACRDENGNLTNGRKGDQTGREVAIRDVSKTSENWKYVFRCKNAKQHDLLGSAMEQACNNNNIGYSQNDRYSLYTEMSKTGNISAIKTPCNCDCSSLVADCCIIVGINVSRFMCTSDEEKTLDATGAFNKIAFAQGMSLERGDILLRSGHTAIVTQSDATANTAPAPKKEPIVHNIDHNLNGINYDAVFNASFYYDKYADLRNAGLNTDRALWEHFKNFGMNERRQASAEFNVDVYKNSYADLQRAFGNNTKSYYQHYCQYGKREGRKAI